jgi:fumarate reductase flavoprotein subunit
MRAACVLAVFAQLVICSLSAAEEKASREISPSHKEAELNCADCHGVAVPEKRAPAAICVECHTKKEDSKLIEFDDGDRIISINPHNSHIGEIRCTHCHRIHTQSVLHCNDACHHKFKNTVP